MGFVVHELLERFLIPNPGVSRRAGRERSGWVKGARRRVLVGRLLYETFSWSDVFHCFCQVVPVLLEKIIS